MNISEFRVDGPTAVNSIGDVSFEARQRIEQFVANNRDGAFGLSEVSARQIAEFIERRLSEYTRTGNYYIRKEVTGLPNTVEYDPLTKKVFIHLKTHGGVALIGEGGQKRITKTIEYALQPKIYANAIYRCKSKEDLESARIELDVIRRLQGKKGIIEVISTSEHQNKKETFSKVQIISKLYNKSSLEQFVVSDEKLTLEQKKNLAVDILEGCVAMHKEGIVHRDIKPENVFIERTDEGVYKAVIADFGTAKNVKDRSYLSFSHGTPGYTPPFAANPKKIRQRDKKRVDLFPMASTIVTIFTGSRIEVGEKKPKKDDNVLGKIVKKIKKEAKSKKYPKAERKMGKIIADMLETGRKGKVKRAKRNAETYLKKLKKIKAK